MFSDYLLVKGLWYTSKSVLNNKFFKAHYYVVEKNKTFNRQYQNYIRYLIRKNCYLHVGIILDINHFKFNLVDFDMPLKKIQIFFLMQVARFQ